MKVGLTASTFDLLHAGHIEMLREAKSQCDYLICALQIDPSKKEVLLQRQKDDLEDILNMRTINVRILGEEYRDKEFTGRDICKKRDIELHFNKRDHRFSSSDLRKRIGEMHVNNGQTKEKQ